MILSDLDGVLVDSGAQVERIWREWAAARGLDPEVVARASHGVPARQVIERVAPDLDAAREAERVDALHAATGGTALPGAHELLAREDVAVVTSCSRALALARLAAAGVPTPRILITSEDTERGKPHPDPYLAAAAAVGAAPADCVVIEDAPAGIAAARPEVVIHELTALPDRFDPRDREVYAATNRLRSEGTRNLLAAADAAGARRFICQSIAFAYAPGPRPEVKEDAPLFLDAPEPFGDGVRVIAEMEAAVLARRGLVLRYGWFYGPGTYHGADGATTREVRRRRFPVVGSGAGLFSFIHVDDAAAATVAAVERGEPGVYNVVDDEPAPMRDWLPAFAAATGAKRPFRVPLWLARVAVGGVAAATQRQAGASNAKAKRELGWEPRWATWREGFRSAPR